MDYFSTVLVKSMVKEKISKKFLSTLQPTSWFYLPLFLHGIFYSLKPRLNTSISTFIQYPTPTDTSPLHPSSHMPANPSGIKFTLKTAALFSVLLYILHPTVQALAWQILLSTPFICRLEPF